MKKLCFLLIILFINSCKQEIKGFEISGNLNGSLEGSKIILSDGVSSRILDSVSIINGKFKLSGYLDISPTLLTLNITSGNGERLAYTSIFIGNEKIEISGAISDFPDEIKITGSKFQTFKSKLDKQLSALNKIRDEKLQNMFSLRYAGKWNDSLQSKYWSKNGVIVEIDNQISEKRRTFISNNINTHYALSQLVRFKTDFSTDFIKKQINFVKPKLKKTKYISVLETFIENKPLIEGDFFYDFKAINQNEEIMSFSDFFYNNNKFVLFEFYSPYCGWCKEALPEIKKLTDSKKEILKVITFNVDKNKEDFFNAYKENKMWWPCLWNEDGRLSDVYTKYRIQGTPTYYLFNNEGRVIDKWTGYDKNLVDKIKGHINKL